jgi:hypothetical protein
MEYMWTVESAVWQVQHGGPTQRTLSAIEYLNELVGSGDHVAGQLLDALVEQRGLQHLGEALPALPDDTETLFASGE